MDIITRKQAKELKLPRYFTGKSCPHGHVTERQTVNGTCVECGRLTQIKYHQLHPERRHDYRESQRLKGFKKKHREAYKKRHPEKHKLAQNKWRQKNPQYWALSSIARNRILLESDLTEIPRIYKNSKHYTETTKIPHRVDHVVPIRGELVSGLHTAANLQIITEKPNLHKSNKFDLDLYNKIFDPKIDKTLEQRNQEYTICLLSHLTPSEIYPYLSSNLFSTIKFP